MLGNLADMIFSGVLNVLCFFSGDPSPRKPKMTRKQKKTLEGLSDEQQVLLIQLWEAMLNVWMYRDAYARGHYDLSPRINVASERHQRAVSECRNLNIPENRIAVFRINSEPIS